MWQPTPFIEANALLALDDGEPDYANAREALASCSIRELQALERQSERLAELCRTLTHEMRE